MKSHDRSIIMLTCTSLKEMHIVLCVVFVVIAGHHPERCDVVTSTRVRVQQNGISVYVSRCSGARYPRDAKMTLRLQRLSNVANELWKVSGSPCLIVVV